MPVLFGFGVSMQTQVVRTLAWDFHPCPFLWDKPSPEVSLCYLAPRSFLIEVLVRSRLWLDCRQVAEYLLFSRICKGGH